MYSTYICGFFHVVTQLWFRNLLFHSKWKTCVCIQANFALKFVVIYFCLGWVHMKLWDRAACEPVFKASHLTSLGWIVNHAPLHSHSVVKFKKRDVILEKFCLGLHSVVFIIHCYRDFMKLTFAVWWHSFIRVCHHY